MAYMWRSENHLHKLGVGTLSPFCALQESNSGSLAILLKSSHHSSNNFLSKYYTDTNIMHFQSFKLHCRKTVELGWRAD